MEASVLPTIIAVDFDGTLVEDRYPDIGEIKQEVWDVVKRAKADGCRIILWTCRTDHQLRDAVEFCAAHGLVFDTINKNIPEVRNLYGGDTRKVFADLYIDDRFASVSTQGELTRQPVVRLSNARNSIHSHSVVRRVCACCGVEDHFNPVCPYCGCRTFVYES